MLVADFYFELPESLIAQEARPRGTSRLMVVDRARGTWTDATIADLPSVLAPGDLMVVNDTRVFPARLLGRRDPSGGAVECFLLTRR
ncbi:MAG: S-adenosylmethionine:tRNA ribosyltransferase-isomerase, partial [Acidobacteria bacterium]|nr:S-adenosylmethionine:tRNA ribosyltransferase-isomerase [Acidobacteriota bacterium]